MELYWPSPSTTLPTLGQRPQLRHENDLRNRVPGTVKSSGVVWLEPEMHLCDKVSGRTGRSGLTQD